MIRSTPPEGSISAGMEPGLKFGVLAVDNCLEVKLKGPVQMSSMVEVRTSLGFEIPEHWQRWLGELKTKSLMEANLVVEARISSEWPHVLDAESLRLDTIVMAHFHALTLEGVPDYRGALIAVGGLNAKDGRSVRRVRPVDTAFRHRFGRRLTVDEGALLRAGASAIALLKLDLDSSFRRLRAGLVACFRAIQTREDEGRLHQFVRAVDGLMKLPKGQGRKEFIRRAPTFVTGSNLGLVLEQLYDMRNAHEHLKDFHDAIAAPSEEAFQRLGLLRAYQAERMALHCYRRLLSRPDLLLQFEDDHTIESFWHLSEDDRLALWGERLDLDAVQKEHDRVGHLLRWAKD